MRALLVVTLLALLFLPTGASAEVKTFTATHTYVMGDHDSKDDARQRCLLEAKRKVLEQAGVLIESASEVKDFQLTKDKITSVASAVMQVKDTKEKFGFENERMTLTLTIKADVNLAEVRKQLASRQVDSGVRDTVAAQQERLKHLETQVEVLSKQRQEGQDSRQAYTVPPSDIISAAVMQALRTQAEQGDVTAQAEIGDRYNFGIGVLQDYAQARLWFEKAAAQGNAHAQVMLGTLYRKGQGVRQDYTQAVQWYEKAAEQGHTSAQYNLGALYAEGVGVPQDYVIARQWYEKAAAQGNALAQCYLGLLYHRGKGVPQDYVQARQWYEKAAVQGNTRAQIFLGSLYLVGHGVPEDFVRGYMWYSLGAAHSTGEEQMIAADSRDKVARLLTPAQLAEAQQLARQCEARQFKGC